MNNGTEYLEELLAEWHEYKGYFVYRNLWVGLQADGSYECELNVVGYHPQKNTVIQVEPSLDVQDWEARKRHFQLKFEAGKKYLHRMFNVSPSPKVEQIAVLAFPGEPRYSIAGARVLTLADLITEIMGKLGTYRMSSYTLPDQWPLLRTLQFVAEYRETVCETLHRGRED